MNKTVIVHAPQGAGKTTHAAELAKYFGLDEIVDDWMPEQPFLDRGQLLLTNIAPTDLENGWICPNHERRILSLDQALSLAGIA